MTPDLDNVHEKKKNILYKRRPSDLSSKTPQEVTEEDNPSDGDGVSSSFHTHRGQCRGKWASRPWPVRAIPNAAALPEIHSGRLRDHAGVEDRLFARGIRPPGHRWCRAEEEVCHGSFPVAPLEFYLKFGGGTAKPKNQWTQAWFLVMELGSSKSGHGRSKSLAWELLDWC